MIRKWTTPETFRFSQFETGVEGDMCGDVPEVAVVVVESIVYIGTLIIWRRCAKEPEISKTQLARASGYR